MYNRYISQKQTYAPVAQPAPPHEEKREPPDEKKYIRGQESAQAPKGNSGNFFSPAGGRGGFNLGKLTELLDRDKSGSLGGIFPMLKLEEVDTGDILLILILLLLLVEGDDLELVITLGLMLLMGLGGKGKKEPGDKPSSGAWETC